MQNLVKMIVLMTAVLLAGCHENPLKTHRSRANVDVLLKASIGAERALKLDRRLSGRAFIDCMEGKVQAIDCHAFFKTMLTFINKEPGFEGMRESDLTDRTQFVKLADTYDERWTNKADYDDE